MRPIAAIVVGGLISLGLMLLLVFLLKLLELSVGGYTLFIIGVVGGMLAGLTLGAFSRVLGTAVGLILVILLSIASALVGPLASIIIGIVAISAICYFIAGFIAGVFSGVSHAGTYNWGRGAAMAGMPAGFLLLGFNLIYHYATGSAVMGDMAFMDAVAVSMAFALVLSAIGGATGGQIAGARV